MTRRYLSCGRLALFMIFALALAPPAAMAGAKNQKSHAQSPPAVVHFTREVYLGISSFRFPDNGACIFLGAYFNSDDLEGLSLMETPSGPEFHKQDQLVETFPDTVMIEVRAFRGLTGCDLSLGKTTNEPSKHKPKPPAASSASAPSPVNFNYLLRFEVAFVRGSSTMPAELISTHIRESPSFEGGLWMWNYEVLIRTKQAPLTDQINLSVLSQNGQLLTHITGGLDTPLNRMLYGPQPSKPKHASGSHYPDWWDR
jgi:hypothetical protein